MRSRTRSVPFRTLLGATAAVAFLAVPASASAVLAPLPGPSASPASGAVVVACKPWQAVQDTGADGHHYVVRNKPSINHNDEGMCLTAPNKSAAFTVTRSPGTRTSSKVRAYPYIASGCFEGACAGGREGYMPRAGSLGKYTISWATVQPPRSGVWNASLDLWLGPRKGEGYGEVMIWLRYSKASWWERRAPSVRIDGAKWYIVGHVTGPGRHYISFRRATPATSATLLIAPFMAAAEHRGDVRASWYLWSAQAGFEIWSGGKGLAVSRFSITG